MYSGFSFPNRVGGKGTKISGVSRSVGGYHMYASSPHSINSILFNKIHTHIVKERLKVRKHIRKTCPCNK